MGKISEGIRREHGRRGGHVVAGVRRRRQQRLGADALAELPVKQAQPELCRDGQQQHRRADRRERDRLRMQDALDGAFDQLRADQQNERRHRQPREIFHPLVAVGVRVVGGLRRELEAEQRHDGACRVGEVVDGVCHDRDAPGQRAREELSRAQQGVDHDAGQTGELSVALAHGRRLGVLMIFDKKPQKKLRHENTSFKVDSGYYTPRSAG